MMKPKIWLRSAALTWLESATDDMGTLDISRIAKRTDLRPETVLFGDLGAYEGITISEVRDECGSTAGESKESAVLVDGYAAAHTGGGEGSAKRLKSYETAGPSLSEATPGETQDRSETWIGHMLLPQLPELPKNKSGLANILFPEELGKLPVTKEIYKYVAAGMPKLAADYLLEADGSKLPVVLGAFLLEDPEPIVTEIQTTILVGGILTSVLKLFKDYTRLTFNTTLTLSFNATETRKRPDTIGIASGCTLLVGEDKVDNLLAADGDLRSKMRSLNPMFYGKLEFILGYIAAGTQFQWVYMGKNGGKEMYRVPPLLDLSHVSDRCRFLLSLGYAFQLLAKMQDSIPVVPGCRAMFSMDESPDGRKILFYNDKVEKSIRDFPSYCAKQGTTITAIKKAYAAAINCTFLPWIVAGPIEGVHGSYRAEFGPLGYLPILGSEEDCKWMAQCVPSLGNPSQCGAGAQGYPTPKYCEPFRYEICAHRP